MAIGRTNAVGTALNFNVVAGTSSPSSPKENTIWVKASSVAAVSFGPSAMPSYSTTANSVYIGYAATSSSTSSGTRLSFIKQKANILSVPGELLSCYQYQSYTWKKVYAYIYKSGSWVQFSSEFSATIAVTYPSGSTLTCSDGSTTLTATTTTGSYTFDVPNTGTWTVSCTDGSSNASQAVSITADGVSVTVTLTYFDGYLFNNGAWSTYVCPNGINAGSDGFNESHAVIYSGNLRLTSQCRVFTADKIDVSKYSKITVTISSVYSATLTIGLATSASSNNAVATAEADNAGDCTISISELSGSYYLMLSSTSGATNDGQNTTISAIRLT